MTGRSVLSKAVWNDLHDEKLRRIRETQDDESLSVQGASERMGVPVDLILPAFGLSKFDRKTRISGKDVKAKGPVLVARFEPQRIDHFTKAAAGRAPDFETQFLSAKKTGLPDLAPIWPRRCEEAKAEARRRLKFIDPSRAYPPAWVEDTFGLAAGSYFHNAAKQGTDHVSRLSGKRVVLGTDLIRDLPVKIEGITIVPGGGVVKRNGRIVSVLTGKPVLVSKVQKAEEVVEQILRTLTDTQAKDVLIHAAARRNFDPTYWPHSGNPVVK